MQDQNKTPNPSQGQPSQVPIRSKWVRVLALIAAVAVILGSIFIVQALGVVKPPKQPGDASQMLLSTARAEAAPADFKTLQKGASGAYVKKVQQGLKALEYYDGPVDGNFSRVFEEAVIAFQKDFGLTANGKIDWDLYQLITEDLPQDIPSEKPTARPQKTNAPPNPAATATPAPDDFVVFGESYTDKDHVAVYIHQFGELPPNYITKKDATALGWVNSWGNLWDVAPGKSIGGDYFGNYEGQLPTAKGRKYYECDIDYDLDRAHYRGRRNGKRIIFSSDGLIFYTEDHYETFQEITFEEIR